MTPIVEPVAPDLWDRCIDAAGVVPSSGRHRYFAANTAAQTIWQPVLSYMPVKPVSIPIPQKVQTGYNAGQEVGAVVNGKMYGLGSYTLPSGVEYSNQGYQGNTPHMSSTDAALQLSKSVTNIFTPKK